MVAPAEGFPERERAELIKGRVHGAGPKTQQGR